MIEAVTFDLWNTLLCDRHYGDYRIGLLMQILRDEGAPRDRNAVEAAYQSAMNLLNEAWRKERRHIPAAELTEFILSELDIDLPSELKSVLVRSFEEVILNDPPPLVKDAGIVLQSLHSRFRIGLISNAGVTPGRNLRRVLNGHGVLQYFRCTVFSDEVGYHKPHPTIFRKAVEELQVKASETLHVGDLLEADIIGAKAMGMKAVWFNVAERSYQKGTTFVPDYEIQALSQLLEII
jgi:putative hydrolase of the HAD superfamily